MGSIPFHYKNRNSTSMGCCCGLEQGTGIDLHFRLWRKYWMRSVEPSRAALIRAALNGFDSLPL